MIVQVFHLQRVLFRPCMETFQPRSEVHLCRTIEHHKKIVSGLRLRFPIFHTPVSTARVLVMKIVSRIPTYLAFEELDYSQS
jgi:hypothetical protein